jgi:hypothetical protein
MKCTYHLAPPHKLLPYPCPICGGKFGTAQLVVLNGIRRHGIRHPYFRSESRDSAHYRMLYLKSLKSKNGHLPASYKNRLVFRIYHYSSEKYNNVKKQMKPKPWKKNPRKIKKAYGREIHSFRTQYDIHLDYKTDTKVFRIPLQDIFLVSARFHNYLLKRNQRSKSWSLSEKTVNEKNGFQKELYELIKENGWYYREPRSRRIT